MQKISSHTARTCRIVRLGCVEYETACEWQRQVVTACSAGRCDDTLLLLEHPPTITLGRNAQREHVLFPADELSRCGVALVASDRGGDVTYHAPGQLVGYPILKLSRYGRDLGRYLRNLEETLIQTLATYGIRARHSDGLTGVWVGNDKIAAIGVRLSASGVTSHGFALNIHPDMRGFARIIPCGIRHGGVTSMERLLGFPPAFHEVTERVIHAFGSVFEATPIVEQSQAIRIDCLQPS